MSEYQDAVDIVDEYMRAMSAKDYAAVMELYADDAVLEDPVGSEIQNGKEAISNFYFGIGEADLTCTRTGVVRYANREMVFPFECEMKSPEGKMTIAIIDHFVLNDEGKIKSMRAFWGPETATMG